MKVVATKKFRDKKENRTREIGDIFTVSKVRYDEILTKGGPWIEIVDEEQGASSKSEEKTKSTTNAKSRSSKTKK